MRLICFILLATLATVTVARPAEPSQEPPVDESYALPPDELQQAQEAAPNGEIPHSELSDAVQEFDPEGESPQLETPGEQINVDQPEHKPDEHHEQVEGPVDNHQPENGSSPQQLDGQQGSGQKVQQPQEPDGDLEKHDESPATNNSNNATEQIAPNNTLKNDEDETHKESHQESPSQEHKDMETQKGHDQIIEVHDKEIGNKTEDQKDSIDEKPEQKASEPETNDDLEDHHKTTLGNPHCPDIPGDILNVTVTRILKVLSNDKCYEKLNLKLLPVANKMIKGHILEVSSMPIDLMLFLTPAQYRVNCSRLDNVIDSKGEKPSKIRLSILLDSYDHRFRSRWRLFPRLYQDDIPLDIFDNSPASQRHQMTRQSQSRPSRVATKCQRFKVEDGDFYLDLLSPRSKFDFEVDLGKSNGDKFDGKIELIDFRIDEMYLSHSLKNSNGRNSSASNQPASTVQILHEHNNHYRRNNWLLDLYGNLLRHEYKRQLSQFFGGPFVSGLNSCLINNNNYK